MKIHIALKIARQVEGDYVFVNAIKASTDKDMIHNFLRTANVPATEEIDGIGCVIEVGVLEDVEVDTPG